MSSSDSDFYRSSFCGSGNCAETAERMGSIEIRNSTDTSRVLRFSKEEWTSFVRGIKAGEFDSYLQGGQVTP